MGYNDYMYKVTQELNAKVKKKKMPSPVIQGKFQTMPGLTLQQKDFSDSKEETLAQARSLRCLRAPRARGLCKSLSILGHPVVFDTHYYCTTATLIVEIFIS